MTITRRSLSDTYSEHDAIIEAAQTAKREATMAYRAQLDASGMDRDNIRDEIDGFKVAYRRKVAVKKKGEDVVEHRNAIADEIYEEITAPAPRATRVASAVPHDADGVVLESEEIDTKATADKALGVVTAEKEINQSQALPATSGETAANAVTAGSGQTEGMHVEGGDDVANSPAHAPEQPGSDHGSVSTPDEGGANSSTIPEPQQVVQPDPASGGKLASDAAVIGLAGPAFAEDAQQANTKPAHNSEPVTTPTAIPPAEVTAAAGRHSVSSSRAVPAGDRTKPHPWCGDPEECGVEASWNHMCGSCLRRRGAERASAEALH